MFEKTRPATPQFQRRELMRYFSELNSYSWRHSFKEPAPPECVLRARRVCQIWDRKTRKLREHFDKKRDKLLSKIREEIHFGSPIKALAMIRKARTGIK